MSGSGPCAIDRRAERSLPAAVCALAVGLAMQARPAAACSCEFPASIEQSIDRSAAIFFGRAVRIEWTGGDPEPGPGLPNLKAVTFEVERQWKGTLGDTITIHTGSGGGDCGSPFDVGLTYLVYATASSASDSTLQTSICHRGLVAGANDPRMVYEFDRLDQLVLDRGAPDPETAHHHDEIRRSYDGYRTAVMHLRNAELSKAMARDAPPGGRAPPRREATMGTAEDVVAFLCGDVVDHYAKLRELALHASKQELLAGSLWVAMEVLALRYRIDAATLSAMSPAELMRRFYEAGWEPRLGFIELELGKFGPLGDAVLVDGVQGSSNLQREVRILERSFRFEAVPTGWCLDTTWSPFAVDGGQSLRYTADAVGKPLEQLVLEGVTGFLQQSYGRPSAWPPAEPGPALWEPLATSP